MLQLVSEKNGRFIRNQQKGLLILMRNFGNIERDTAKISYAGMVWLYILLSMRPALKFDVPRASRLSSIKILNKFLY